MTAAQIMSALAVTVCLLIDGMLTSSHLGQSAMAAFGIAGAVIFLFVAAGGTIASGGQILCGKAFGSGDRKELDSSFSSAMTMGIVVSAVCTAGVLLFADPISVAMGAVPGTWVQVLTRDYLLGYIIGCPGFIMMQTINPFLYLIGKKRTVMAGMAAMILVDIGADLLNFHVLHWGTFGMGLATAMSYYAAFLVSLICLVKNRGTYRFRPGSVSLDSVRAIPVLGSTYAMYQICRGLFRMTANHILMQAGGESVVAVYSVINSVYGICLSAGMGIAATSLLMSGVCYGEGDRKGLDDILGLIVRYSLIINTALAAAVILFADPIISLFSSDPAIRSACVDGIRIVIIGIIPFSFAASMRSFYQGIHRITLSQGICIFQNYVSGTAMMLLVIALMHSGAAPWIGIAAGEAVTVLFILALCGLRNRRPVRRISDLNMADPSVMNTAPQAAYSIRSREEAVQAACGMQEACRSLGLADADGMALAICMEELAVNTFRHGAAPGSKDVSVEVTLARSRGGYVLTQTDNARLFDPVRYDELNRDDPEHIGIRTVRKLAKEMHYRNVFGLNRITVRV